MAESDLPVHQYDVISEFEARQDYGPFVRHYPGRTRAPTPRCYFYDTQEFFYRDCIRCEVRMYSVGHFAPTMSTICLGCRLGMTVTAADRERRAFAWSRNPYTGRLERGD